MADPGSYGPVVFETSDARIRTFTGLRENRRARYATHDVINQEQLLQFLTVELAQVDFTIILHHRFCDPAGELEDLKTLLADHEAYALVIGDRILGEFVLENFSAPYQHVADNGVVMHAKTDLHLKEYR